MTWIKYLAAPEYHRCDLPDALDLRDTVASGSVWRCDECRMKWTYNGVNGFEGTRLRARRNRRMERKKASS